MEKANELKFPVFNDEAEPPVLSGDDALLAISMLRNWTPVDVNQTDEDLDRPVLRRFVLPD